MNLCCACFEDFSSVRLFDTHRVGKHAYDYSPEQPDGRRCLSIAEMAEKGWEKNDHGRWSDPVHAAQVREAFAEADSPRTVRRRRPANPKRGRTTPRRSHAQRVAR